MRFAVILLAFALVAGVPAGASAQNGCNGGPAPIVLKNSSGTLVVCGVLEAVDPNNRLDTRLSFAARGEDSRTLAGRLTKMYGAPVVLGEGIDAATLDLDVANARFSEVLLLIAERGQVTVGDLDFKVLAALRSGLIDGGGVQASFHETTLGNVLSTLSRLTGREIVTDAANLDKMVTTEFENASLRDILKTLALTTGSKITLKKASEPSPLATE